MTSSLIRQNEVATGLAPVTYDYTSTWDVATSAWQNQVDNFNFTSSDNLKYDARKEQVAKYEQLSGKSLSSFGSAIDGDINKAWEMIDKDILQKRNEGVLGWDQVPTSDEVMEQAREKARQAGVDFQDTVARAAPDAYPTIGSIAGSIAGWMSDPVQAGVAIATAPLTGGGSLAAPTFAARAAWVGRAALAEAGVSAATEIPLQFAIKDWQQEIGNEYGFGDVVESIALAGAGGAIVSGGVNTALRSWRFANVRPRAGDGETEQVVIQNIKDAGEQLSAGVPPQQLKLDPRAVGRKFEGGLTYDHLDVADRFVSAGLKESELDKFAKSQFISEKIKEYGVDATLFRAKDLSKAQEDYLAVADSIPKMVSEAQAKVVELDAIEAKLADISKRYGEKSDEASLVAKEYAAKEAQIKAMDKKIMSAYGRRKSLAKEIHSTKLAQDADKNLLDLSNNKIPDSLAKKYSAYKKNVKEALAIRKDYDKQMRDYADQLLERPNITPDSEMSAIAADPSYSKAVEQAYKAEVADVLTGDKKDMDVIIDGVKRKMSEVDAEIKAEQSFAKRIMACAFGGAA